MNQGEPVVSVNSAALYLLLIYLEKQRRLCAQARDGDNFTWAEGKAFYDANYKSNFSRVIAQLDELIRAAQQKKRNPFRRICYLNYLFPFSERLPVSLTKIESVRRCFATTHRLYTAEQEPPWEAMQENMVFAAELMESFRPWLNPEKRIKEYDRIPEIGYSKEPPVSINELMLKYFRQSEGSILDVPFSSGR